MDHKGLIEKLRQFRNERDWGQFHTPSALIRSVAIEAGELLETVQWLTDEQAASAAASDPLRGRIIEESADVFLYLLLVSDRLGFDLVTAGQHKIEANRKKYPVSTSKGNAHKHKPS